MFRWADFESAAPELAAQGRELLDRFGFVLAGTIRRDGTPRISPVEARVVAGHLMIVMIPGTHKARDILRDSRLVLNTPVFDPADPGYELKLRGRAVPVEDRAQLEATAEATEVASGWRPPTDWHFFSIDVEDVTLMEWDRGALAMTRWVAERGLERTTRPAPLLDDLRG